MTVRLPILCLMFLSLAACGEDNAAADIAGTYSFEAEGEAQTLDIGGDGHFVNSYYRDGALVWRDEGAWTFYVAGRETGVTFEDFRLGLADEFAERGYWFVAPERTWLGATRFCFDRDDDRCLEES